ncbi:hypothetical protein PC118_g17011 [Phytophthora cactorum]|uniref:Uncharacterized protein n=1 Tax=Phytophthora cactorum TaxID=29920 RepID=A0A8T1FH49_9STRA|nr:hypothetical protein PC118_g17011 [Phytophthora cactorum]
MLANRRRSPLEHLLDYPGWISRITRPLSEARDYVKISEIWCINNRSFVFNMALLFLRSIAKPFLLYPVSMSTQREDGTSEPTVISRRQAELVEANERLQRTAQNFSLEWKSFLRYAMKIKQQATAPGGKELEDLLLKTQGGLVLIRELRNRRDQQWKEVAECYGYQRLSITDNNTDGDDTQQSTKQQKWLQILVSKLFQLNLQVAATAHCAVKRSQSILSPNLLKLRAHALETYHRMEHGVEGSIDFVHAQDVNFLLQFDYLKHQQSIVLERFCIRLKWLPVSHRFHLRQRMLALIHQQKMKNTPRPSASTAYRNSEEHIHCPLLMTSTTHFIAELKALTQQYSLSLPDVDNREYEGFRQSADECLDAVVISFPPDNAINTDRELEMNLETLVHTYTRSSRWDLIQRGYLGNCEPGQGPIEDALIALRNEHKIDSLLACEWELLTLDGTEYLRVRLEKLSKAHSNRAQVDVAAVTGIKTVEYQHVETTEEAADSNNDDANGMSELTNSWNPDALYSLYALRVSSCRAKRLSLLRLLNYLHFIQFSQVNSRHDISSNSTDNTQQKPTTPISSKTGTVSVEDITINPWRVTKCETSGDYIITRPQSTAKNDINDDENDNNGDREFIFAAARRDLEVLELQVLRIASIFIFKQEYDSLPTSPHKRSNGRNASQRESDFVVTPIDRLQVLRDIYDCEVAFQQAKVQLVEILLENGLQFAPRSQDLSELNFTLEAQIDPFADILLPLLHQRPYLDFSHAYFFESYAAETIFLELQTSLIQQMEQHFKREAQAESLEPWRRSLLQLQRQYVAYLGGSVKYQDAVGADVFEFAASYPYVCLANSFAPESSDEKSTIAMDLNTVRTKYAKEIADKMTEELKTDCFPYWKRLENLKQQLQERGDREACGHFLDEESSHPRLLTTLNDHLQRLRNEKKLMQHLSAATRARCAFTIQIDEDQSSKLTKWLMTKLHQLKVDLHIHERPKVEQLLLTPPASCSSPLAPPKRVLDLNRSRSSSDIHALLESIPSFRSLLHTFATPASNERPTSGAATAHAIRRQEYREETLRTLVCIFHQFSCTLDLLRIRCGSHFASTRKKILSTPEGTHSGLSRLERWQTLFHHEIRQLLDHLVNRFSPEAALATGDLFDAHPEYLQSQHHTSLMREEMCAALHEANVHLIRILRCTSNFAILQTYQKNAGLHVRKRRQHLMNFQFILEKIITIHGKELSDKASFTANMKQLVLAGEQALFGEVRPREREREWQAFEDAVSKYEPKDIEVMARLLELHRVYIDENCRAALRLAEGDTKPSLSLQCTAENEALVALEDLWERFHLPEWDSSVGATPVIGGENLGMKKRLLLEMGTSSSASSSTELSYALRSLQMGATAPLTHFCTSGLLVLPSPCNVKEQLVYLQLSVELTWVDADMKELEDHYKKLLFRRKKHREHQRTSRKSPQSSCASSSSLLFSLSKYYHEKRISGDTELSDTSPSESVPAFIVPAAEMSAFLHDVTKKCTTHNKHQLDLHSSSIQKMYDHFQAASLTHLKIETQWEKARVEERIRREAFAADHAYHLYFEVEALRKHLRVLEARRELDRQVMRCELNAEYEEKLHAMHEQLLNKQHKFAEYRATMQRELQAVIQGAHSQFVDQLLDYSGTIPSTTKHSVSHLLRGQQDIVRIKSENAAMKQALLKVQALEDMQQQTQNAAKERELLLSQRFATAESLLCSEVEQLQAYVKQLEQNMTKLSREKTYFQVKWTTAHKEMEATAQRRREEKVRILSATHNRTDSEDLPAISPNIRAVPDSTSDTESTLDGSAGRTQNVASTVDTGKQERQRLETQYLNSTRHYQNEIRRLQQQVTRELREKATIAEQLTQLRQYESAASIQADDLQTLGEHSLRRDFRLQPTPRRTQSASPRAVNTCVATPPDRMTILKRPSSSFSPRASLLRAQVTVGSSSNIPVASSRPGTASGTTARKFQVIKRETNAVGGVAGVSNSFSVREPLPYR